MFFLSGYWQVSAQVGLKGTQSTRNIEDKRKAHVGWILGFGINAVDDSGSGNDFFNISEAWNVASYPSRLSVGTIFPSGLGVEAIMTFNTYKEGKIVDFNPIIEPVNYVAFDTRLVYDLSLLFGQNGWLDPYLGTGWGITKMPDNNRTTMNAVLGFRTWLSVNWALDFNTTAKWSLSKRNGATNHLQHGIGLVYKIKTNRE